MPVEMFRLAVDIGEEGVSLGRPEPEQIIEVE